MYYLYLPQHRKCLTPPPQKIEVASSVGIYGGYFPSGFPVIDSPVIQGETNISYRGFTLTLWGSYDIERNRANEWDAIVDYSRKVGKLNLSTGYGYFVIPHTDVDKLNNVYGRVSFDVPLNPSVKWEYLFNDGSGHVFTFGVEHEFDVPIKLSAAAVYNHEMFLDDSEFTHLKGSIGVPLRKGKLKVTPSINGIKALDHQNFEDQLFFSVRFDF